MEANAMPVRSPVRSAFLAVACLFAVFSARQLCAQDKDLKAATTTGATNVIVSVNVLANRHPISPYIYGASFPPSTAYIKTGGVTLSRWGGNNSSRYNWKLNAKNDDADWYFENYSWGSPDSAAYISQAVAGGAAPIMTIPMLEWVAKDTTSSSFSVKKYGAQCAADPYNSDAGDGILPGTNCLYGSDYLTGNNPTDA